MTTDSASGSFLLRVPFKALLLLTLVFSFVSAASGQAQLTGQWQTLPNTLPVNPIHVALLRTGKVLAIGGSENDYSNWVAGRFRAALWDPQTGTATIQTVPWDMFCNGMVNLPDGRLFIAGGNLQYDPFWGLNKAAIFDPSTNQYVEMQSMAHGRWYPTTVVLADGRVLTISGLNDTTGATNNTFEIYKVGSGWSQEFAAGWTPPLYPRLHLLPNGKVFYSGSGPDSALFDPATNAWTVGVAHTNYGATRIYGSSVLLPLTPQNNYKPRVMILGGGYPATATTEIIDLSVASPAWRFSAAMSSPRIEMNAVLLPNGKVLALGGSANDEDAATAALNADLFDPVSETFSSAGTAAFPRLYHSIGLLLPDATVWVAGGNPVRGSYEDHVEIYSPSYLFTTGGSGRTIPATRPTITSAPSVIGYGQPFNVQTPDASTTASLALMRLGAPTHASDFDQRMIGLSFAGGSGTLTVTGPPNSNIAPPGYYMLFLVNGAGVPSVAAILQVSATPADKAPKGTIIQPAADVVLGVGQSVYFAGSGSDPDGTITSYSWVFPGGTPSQSTLQNPGTVTFSAPGTYIASLTVVDNAGVNDPSPPTRTIVVQPTPTLSGLNPSSGAPGQNLNVTLTGSNFVQGDLCDFGPGITVTSCVVNSSTQLTATIGIAASAVLGSRTVTVANGGGQSSSLPGAFLVRQSSSLPPPTLTSVSPNHANQGQTITVILAGTNFQNGATCAFGASVTVNSCIFNSSTQITAGISISATATPGTTAVTETNPDLQSSSMLSGFSVSGNGGLAHIDFDYVDRNALLSNGWSYKATTAAGGVRDTEQSGALQVNYDQNLHPGLIRIPLGPGELWQSLNSSENMLVRVLPSNWSSIRLKIGAFSPSATYQQTDLLVYQDDDNYIDLSRIFNAGGNQLEFFREAAQATAYTSQGPLPATTNLILRIDKNGNVYSGFYSVDNGSTWTSAGSITSTLNNQKLAIETGSNPAAPIPADLSWAEIVMSTVLPAPAVSGTNPSSAIQGQTLNVVISGSNFQNDAYCTFGPGITVNSCAFNTASQLTANITIPATAPTGLRALSVTNPDNQSATLNTALTVTAPTPPTVSSIAPASTNQGQTLSATITGNAFLSGATCDFGSGITVTSCAFVSSTQLTANISIAFNATTGSRTVTVTNPGPQSGSLANAFAVTAAPPPPPPSLTSATPNSGQQNSTLSVVLAGSNFQSGATCNFGAGITVNSCTFNSATQLTANISIAAGSATGSRSIVVTNPDTQSSTLTNGFTVLLTTGPLHLDFNYPDRGSLLNAGWSYVATTAAGGTRDTEQTGALAPDYSQTAHPGTIRLPVPVGELWQALNSSQNTLFHALPANWTSIRLDIASFAPFGSFQQAGLLVYQDDDNYLDLSRGYGGSPNIEFFRELAQSIAYITSAISVPIQNDIFLRIDRSGNTYSTFYSTNGGTTWTANGSVTLTLTNPKLAIESGGNQQASNPNVDYRWIEIVQAAPWPAPVLSSISPTSGFQGATLNVVLTGSNFQSGAICTFGTGITVNSCKFNSATQLTANITIASSAPQGAHTVTVVNLDSQSASLAGFTVNPLPAPVINGASPASGAQGQNLNVTLNGANFQVGAACSFGAGITANSCSVSSSTKLIANIDVTASAALGPRTVSVTNPGGPTGSLASGFTVTAATAASSNATALVLVNSTNTVGYNISSAFPGEFQRYIQTYLDHLQVPYEIADVSAGDPPPDLANRALIISGHSALQLSPAWQAAVQNAVNDGSGFVNLDSDLSIGSAAHIKSIFGATGAVAGTPATSIAVPAAIVPGGANPHFIAALQRRFMGDPAGDIVYFFHPNSQSSVQPATSTLLQGASGTVIANLGSDPLIVAKSFGAGRAVHFGTYDYLRADRFGFVQGVDDLFWRSLVWAARKPFVFRGYPHFWAVQMDDTNPGWASSVQDLYNPAFTGNAAADGTGGPWKVTGYLFINNLPAGSAERASAIADINAGKLQVVPHAFTAGSYGDIYWNSANGQLTDAQWLANVSAVTNFKNGNGGADTIPFFSRALVAHWWDLGNNSGYDLWNTLGFRYITSIQKPGYQQPFANLNQYNGAERLNVGPFWKNEQPPKNSFNESFPLFFADDYPVGSRAGLPSYNLYIFTSQYIDLGKYPRADFIWPSPNWQFTVAQSVDQLQRYTWRHWSGMNPLQLFTHHASNYELSSAAERQSVITQSSAWLQANGVRHVFMQDLGDYIYARNKSRLTSAVMSGTNFQMTFTGSAATADGVLIPTQVMVFYQDVEARSVAIPGFTNGWTTSFVVSTGPTISSVTPAAGTGGQTFNAVIGGFNFKSGATCAFGAGITVNSCTFNSATQLTANITITTTAALGPRTVQVTVPTGDSGSLANGFNVIGAPTLTSASPSSGIQGTNVSVTLTGTNFVTGATCNFGAGITVNSCTFSSSTQLTAAISIATGATVGARTVVVTNPDGASASLANGFTVQAPPGATHINFTYANRTALLADSWSYIATTAAGAPRDTEQTGALAPDYNQATHAGTIRIPLGPGELWQALNSSQNTLFRTLPTNWTSIRLKIASFSPVTTYQQVGLIAYQDDDNYVYMNRIFNGYGNQSEFLREIAQATAYSTQQTVTTTTNLLLRIDRSGNVYTGFYSTDNGGSWVSMGSLTVALTNPKLGIQVGSNPSGAITADLAWVEIL